MDGLFAAVSIASMLAISVGGVKLLSVGDGERAAAYGEKRYSASDAAPASSEAEMEAWALESDIPEAEFTNVDDREEEPLDAFMDEEMEAALDAARKAYRPPSLPLSEMVRAKVAEYGSEARTEAIENALQYCFMDLEGASEELGKTILDSRKTVIFNASWTADDCEGFLIEADGTCTMSPKFHDLFPADWELPRG
ncbi:MAG: hypothetical protein LBU32_05140 [Clostridiales bacterium]|jgi:hypothetical protein|nr:hypothetical protein [Clostridiales bacterium]